MVRCFDFASLTHELLRSSLSVPYFPPNKRYIPPDEAARKVPSFGYQAYFNDPQSSKEVDEHVRKPI